MPRSQPHQDLAWPPAPDDLAYLDLEQPEQPPPSTGFPGVDETVRRAPERRAGHDPSPRKPEPFILPPARPQLPLVTGAKRFAGRGALALLAVCLLAALVVAVLRLAPAGPAASPGDAGAPADTLDSTPPVAAEPPAPTTGSLAVRTEPAGAIVTVDGKRLGASPVIVPSIGPGEHAVVIQHAGGTYRHAARVAAGETVSLVVPLPAAAEPAAAPAAEGSIQVRAPFELRVTKEGRLLGTSEMDRIPLDAGTHTVQLTNEAVGYQASRTVRVSAGRTTIVEAEVPEEPVAINAIPWAEVTIDGRPVGQTPLGALTVPIGPHLVVLSHPRFGEKTVRTTVRAGEPARISVDMRR
ncbi:MAG: PEGA domain-containing protein [Kiritimatiellae bacterium]|nr:PEGA domain-containing protein [Kiritimatiellia bacterium]HOC17507.1 PEGA domain-containing protein [Vicinamibacterales bacterium]